MRIFSKKAGECMAVPQAIAAERRRYDA